MADHSSTLRGSAPPRSGGELALAISNRIVGVHKQLYGKGPTKARTFYQDDMVVVLTRGGFSTVEDTLYRAGRGAAVIAQRAEFQEVASEKFRAAIEELTGRRVLAFMSAPTTRTWTWRPRSSSSSPRGQTPQLGPRRRSAVTRSSARGGPRQTPERGRA